MQRKTRLVLFVVLLVVPLAEAHALRCNGSLVSEGDRSFEVRKACGEPNYRAAIQDPAYAGYTPYEETWFYNFGPQRLIRVLHFRDGRLRRIETAGRGFREGHVDDRPCRPADFSQGMTAYELLERCGEPIERTYRRVTPPRDWRYYPRYERVTVEDWYYDQDERYRPRRVRLHDGRIVDVSTRLD